MSKVETLRCAVDYIKNLKVLLDATGGGSLSPSSLHAHSHLHSNHSNSSAEINDFILRDDEDDDEEEELRELAKSPSENSFPSVSEFEQAFITTGHLHHHQNQGFFAQNGPQPVHFGNPSGIPQGNHQLSPTSSEDPSSPPYVSEGSSYVTSNHHHQHHSVLNGSTTNGNSANATNGNTSNNNTAMYDYENYEPVSPEDEELLDAISWWQQS